MRHFRRHADGIPKRRVRMNGLANVDGVRAYFNRQRNLANHVARMRADHATAQNLAVAVGLGLIIKQQFGETFVAATCASWGSATFVL